MMKNIMNKQNQQEPDSEALSSLLMLSKTKSDEIQGESYIEHGEEDFDVPDLALNTNTTDFYNGTDQNVLINYNNLNHNPNNNRKRSYINNTERSIRGDLQPLAKLITIDDLRKFFHLPIIDVANQLGTCTTALKKICRKNNINKWPYRQIRSITKSIQSLEMASLNDSLFDEVRIQYRQQIITLQNAIDELIKDPNSIVELVTMGIADDIPQSSCFEDMTTLLKDQIFNSDINQSNDIDIDNINPNNLTITSSLDTENKNNNIKMKLNPMQWPKPSTNVQQIMQAAARLTSQSIDSSLYNSNNNMDSNKYNNKRKSNTNSESMQNYSIEIKNNQDYNVLENNILHDHNNNPIHNHHHPIQNVEIGNTIVECVYNYDTNKIQFQGPITLAPLNRKKLRPNITRKVVPLMEPDIGSVFNAEFVPQFILNILHNSFMQQRQTQYDNIIHRPTTFNTAHPTTTTTTTDATQNIFSAIVDHSNDSNSNIPNIDNNAFSDDLSILHHPW